MKFTVSSSALYARLTVANKVIATKTAMPILESFLLDIKNGHVSITASDGDKYFITKVPLIDSDNNARFCVNAKLLIESIKELPEQPLTVEYNSETQEIRGLHQTGNFSLLGQDANLYPVCQELEEEKTHFELPTNALVKGINLTLNATSDEELRMIMTCVYLDICPDNITIVATDGRKLVRHINRNVQTGLDTGLILPKKVAAILKSTLAPDAQMTIEFDKERTLMHTEEFDFYFRLVEGNYLNYNTVISTDHPFCATVDRNSLISAIKRISVFCNQGTGLTKMRLENGAIQHTSQDNDYRTTAEENLMCNYNNAPINIGFNSFYMNEMVNVLTADNIIISIADSSRPAVITPMEQPAGEETTMLLMPMMIND